MRREFGHHTERDARAPVDWGPIKAQLERARAGGAVSRVRPFPTVPLPGTVPKRGIGNKRHRTPKKMATTPAPRAGAVFPASTIGADAGRAASATLPFFGCEAEKW